MKVLLPDGWALLLRRTPFVHDLYLYAGLPEGLVITVWKRSTPPRSTVWQRDVIWSTPLKGWMGLSFDALLLLFVPDGEPLSSEEAVLLVSEKLCLPAPVAEALRRSLPGDPSSLDLAVSVMES